MAHFQGMNAICDKSGQRRIEFCYGQIGTLQALPIDPFDCVDGPVLTGVLEVVEADGYVYVSVGCDQLQVGALKAMAAGKYVRRPVTLMRACVNEGGIAGVLGGKSANTRPMIVLALTVVQKQRGGMVDHALIKVFRRSGQTKNQ